MTKRIILTFFTIFGNIIALSACKPQSDISWFTSSPCEAPCWFNIVPGETSTAELVPILQEIPNVDLESIDNRGEMLEIFNDIYYFDWNERFKGRIYLLENRVSEITLKPNVKGYVPKYSLGLTVGEIIEKLGEPDYVLRVRQLGPGLLPMSDAMHPFVVLINADKGIVMVYDAYYLPEKVRNQVTADIKIFQLEFFYPGDYERLLDIGAFSYSDTTIKFQPWRGYGEYPEINQ